MCEVIGGRGVFGGVFLYGFVLMSAGSAAAGDHSHRSMFFVDEYGAKSDGSANALSAIDQAIADAIQEGGGIVQFGAGEYLVEYHAATADQAALNITKGIVVRGVGPGIAGSPQSGTLIRWKPTATSSSPSLMKVGFTQEPGDNVVTGFGMEDLSIIAGEEMDSRGSGHVLWWSGVTASYLRNVQIVFAHAEEAGQACLFVESSSYLLTTSNWITNARFVAPAAGSAGHAVRLVGAADQFPVNDCNFVNCAFEGRVGGGASLNIEASGNGICNNHSFVNCWFDWTSPLTAGTGVLLESSDRNRFVNCRLDGEEDDLALKMDKCSATSFIGSIAGDIEEVPTTGSPAENAARIFDADALGGSLIQIPYFTLDEYSTPYGPRVANNGTLWLGKRFGTATDPDSLFIVINNRLRFVRLDDL